MKKVIALISVLILSSCSGGYVDSTEDFEREYKMSKKAHTMHSYKYLGQKDGKVYLKKSSMSVSNQKQWNHKIFTASLDNLSAETRNELQGLNKEYRE